ncbi:MAG: malate dehydrogenase (quinone), partial [Gammaproteobacteria bacterium]|nr:malate dehydrogenase (quinone) [Gammaproteobacteria bacterium]
MSEKPKNIVLIGAGIMCATLGIFLRKLLPDAHISIYERLDRIAAESSDAWNNAGTGHSAFCELNYTPIKDGSVDISKALEIANNFEISKELWASLVQEGCLPEHEPFINTIPHMSFVWGKENVDFLCKRHEAMSAHPIFQDMEYATERERITQWAPLIMEGRLSNEPYSATRMNAGTDVNFGMVAKGMIEYLANEQGVKLYLGHQINDLNKKANGQWELEIEDLANGDEDKVYADYVFIGAGGATLPLLVKSDIAESQGYGGFPVSGHFLRCLNEKVIAKHQAKVYGKAKVGSPPMSVPHLDTRVIDGKRTLFFGPYAGFTTKFLKNGSYMDLPLSIEMHNVWPMLAAGVSNVDLTKYLIEQVMLSDEERFEELLVYFPNARFEDWELTTAGQRVQIIKKDKNQGGVLKFGTEIVCSADKSIGALLGASPGASTSASIMLEVLAKMFPDELKTPQWQQILKSMIPSYGLSLIDDGKLCLDT